MQEKNKRSLVLTLIVLAAMLSGAAVFPPMVGGDFKFRVHPTNELDSDGVPLAPLTRSIGLISSLEGVIIGSGCVDTPDQAAIYEVLGEITAIGQRDSVKAHAFSEPGCAGLMSTASENTAYIYPGMSPPKPDLLALLKELLERI
jgi:hypothetical protein